MSPVRIVSDSEAAVSRNAWLGLGGVAGALAMLVVLQAWESVRPPPPLTVGAPQIIEQGPMRTVVRVVTRRGAAEALCTLTIYHVRRSYAVNC